VLMIKENTIKTIYEKAAGQVVLNIRHLSKSFGDNNILNEVDLTLKKGENLVVLGKSGAGKSVLIKCIIGLLEPDEGIIEVFGQNITKLKYEGLDQARAKIGFLFQNNALYDSMTVRENLEFPLRRHWMHLSHGEIDELVLDALGDVGLAHTIDMMPSELSGGMRKRIALARTLILKPEIVLYDEPTTGLDPITAKEIIELIVEIQRKYHASSLIITHDMNCVRMASDRIVLLLDGRCYTEGTYGELLASTDPRVKAFFE
jgi:phospholipid/cholesterol/gamma-HCH transport system ATP-binding protein